MSQSEILELLHKAAGESAYGQSVVNTIAQDFARQPELDADSVLYWLDEKAYYLLTWRQKHLELGETQKAQTEMEQAEVIQKMIDALHGNPFED